MDNHVIEILDELEKWSERLEKRLTTEILMNIQNIVVDAFFRKDIELLNYLNERLGVVRSYINGRPVENVIIICNCVAIDSITNMVKGFMFKVTQGDVFPAVSLINNGEKVLRVVKLKGDKGISFFDLAKYSEVSPGKTQRAIDKLIEQGFARKNDDKVYLTERGERFFDK
ncbi:MAG: hypothetical protein Q7T50_04260 [Candidatus Magasanikbacteria bacterium]|nr:hypothetical protein [Candidatus Magasanikbacteria bacterium]